MTPSSASGSALERTRPALMLLQTLRPINLEITDMVVRILGTLPVLRPLRPAIVAAVGEAFGVRIDELEDCADAANQANAQYLIAATPPAVQLLSEQVVQLRDLLHTDMMALIKRKLIAAAELGELRGAVGFHNQARDVSQLVELFRKRWGVIEQITPVTLADLDNAEALVKEFLEMLGARQIGAPNAAEFADINQRAFTRAVDTYDQARRAVSFLRWNEGDADDFAPSLWAGRGTSSRRRDEEDPSPIAAQPSTPVVPVTPVAPIAQPAAPAIAPGLPGNSPFITR